MTNSPSAIIFFFVFLPYKWRESDISSRNYPLVACWLFSRFSSPLRMTVYQSTRARKQILKILGYSRKDETDLHQLSLDENYFCGMIDNSKKNLEL